MQKTVLVLVCVLLAGCIARNAEKITWNEEGQKISHARTGEAAFCYWFGMKHYWLKSDPNGFSVGIYGGWNKSDPNSIKAIAPTAKELLLNN